MPCIDAMGPLGRLTVAAVPVLPVAGRASRPQAPVRDVKFGPPATPPWGGTINRCS